MNDPRPPDYPAFVGWLGRFLLGLFGWRVVGHLPDYPKMVVVGGPHTSNWDGLVFILASFGLRSRMLWLGKHTLFRGPLGPIMKLGGGVPVNRKTTKNAVEQVVQVFNEREKMVLVIAPEGTRKRAEHWKTGFYYIAVSAKVPIVLAYMDYKRKISGLGPLFHPTGDIEADMVKIKAFYAGFSGKNALQFEAE